MDGSSCKRQRETGEREREQEGVRNGSRGDRERTREGPGFQWRTEDRNRRTPLTLRSQAVSESKHPASGLVRKFAPPVDE